MVAEIISGKPIPQIKRKGAAPKYPWLQLKPGQAFKFVEGVTMNGARSMASQMVNQVDAKFAVRLCEDGIYCWRVDGIPDEPRNGNYRQEVPWIAEDTQRTRPAAETVVVGVERLPPKPVPSDEDAI